MSRQENIPLVEKKPTDQRTFLGFLQSIGFSLLFNMCIIGFVILATVCQIIIRILNLCLPKFISRFLTKPFHYVTFFLQCVFMPVIHTARKNPKMKSFNLHSKSNQHFFSFGPNADFGIDDKAFFGNQQSNAHKLTSFRCIYSLDQSDSAHYYSKKILEAITNHPETKHIILTGMSMGGALASETLLYLYKNHYSAVKDTHIKLNLIHTFNNLNDTAEYFVKTTTENSLSSVAHNYISFFWPLNTQANIKHIREILSNKDDSHSCDIDIVYAQKDDILGPAALTEKCFENPISPKSTSFFIDYKESGENHLIGIENAHSLYSKI